MNTKETSTVPWRDVMRYWRKQEMHIRPKSAADYFFPKAYGPRQSSEYNNGLSLSKMITLQLPAPRKVVG